MEGQVNAVTPLLGDAPNPQPRPDAHARGPAACTHRISRLTLGVSDTIGEETREEAASPLCAQSLSRLSHAEHSGGSVAGRLPGCRAWPGLSPAQGTRPPVPTWVVFPLCPCCVWSRLYARAPQFCGPAGPLACRWR